MCGCGAKTSLAYATDSSKGILEGSPVRYIPGHYSKTERHREHNRKVSESQFKASRRGIHRRMRRLFPPQGKCKWCGAEGWTDYASLTNHDYKIAETRAEFDLWWAELCRSCHISLDGGNPRYRNRVQGTS